MENVKRSRQNRTQNHKLCLYLFFAASVGLFLRVRAKKLIFISRILTVLFMQIQGNACGWF